MIRFQAVDYLILAVYFIFVLGIGWMLRRQIRTGMDFLTSGRKIPAWIAGLAALPVAWLSAGEPIFIPTKIDGPVHDPANHSYWFGPFSECCSVADFNGDGQLDIAAGRNWYEAPDWKKHSDFRDGAETNGPETDNNSEFAMDVNRDGRPDIVKIGRASCRERV